MAFNSDWFEENINDRATDLIQQKLADKSNYFVFPCKWINPLNNTEAGFRVSNQERNHFYQFSQILRGNESLFLNWRNSTILTEKTSTENISGNYIKVDYKKGDVWRVFKLNENGGVQFENEAFGLFGDFTISNEQEKILVKTNYKIGKKELTDFYLIPNPTILENWFENNKKTIYDEHFDDNDIFYISRYTNHYDQNGVFVYSDIEFTNVQFQLSQSGQTIEQHIYFNSPGGGFAIPKLILNDQGIPIDFDLNDNFLPDTGVKTLQIEITGNYAFAGIEIWGIPIYKKNGIWDKNDIRLYAPRKLLVESFDLPVQENFFKVNASENEFLYTNANFTASADFVSYSQYLKDIVGDKRLDYQIILETDYDKTLATNVSKKTINDISLNLSKDFLKQFGTCSVASNQNFYSGDLEDGSLGHGISWFKWEDMIQEGSTVDFKDLFNTTSQIIQNINKLPFETKEKLTMSLRDIWGFGAFLNKITLGFPFFWREVITDTEKNYPRLQKLPLLFPSAFYRFAGSTGYASNLQANSNNTFQNYSLASVISNKSQRGKISGDFFQREQSDLLGSVFGNSSTSTALTINLTDKVLLNSYNKNKVFGSFKTSTVSLNQNQGGFSFPFKWDYFSKSRPANSIDNVFIDVNGDSYIITHIGFKGIGDGDARILTSFEKPRNFSPDVDFRDYINFQTFVNTEAGFRNNQIREWFTLIICSYLDSLKQSDKVIPWPKPLPLVPPSGREYTTDFSTEVNWNLDANTIMQRWTKGARRSDQEGNKIWPTPAVNNEQHNFVYTSFAETLVIGGDLIPAHITENAFSLEFADFGFKTRNEILKVFGFVTVQCSNELLTNITFTIDSKLSAYVLKNNGINYQISLEDILNEKWNIYSSGRPGLIAGGSDHPEQIKIYIDDYKFSIKGKFVSETRIQFDLKTELTISQSGFMIYGNRLFHSELAFRIRNHIVADKFISPSPTTDYYNSVVDGRNGSTIIISANSIIDQ